jgi:hypothetical protein
MSHSEDQNILVIFGGRCDYATKKSKNQKILNDIWILFLENMTWYEIKRVGSIPRERFSHAACMVGS